MLPFLRFYFAPNGAPWWEGAIYGNLLASFILAVAAYFLILKKILICQENWCLRIGHHKVQGTHYKTCPKHTNEEVHNRLYAKHEAKHPEAHHFIGDTNYEH